MSRCHDIRLQVSTKEPNVSTKEPKYSDVQGSFTEQPRLNETKIQFFIFIRFIWRRSCQYENSNVKFLILQPRLRQLPTLAENQIIIDNQK